MTNDDITFIFICPCGVKLADDLGESIIRETVRLHNAEHVERVLEIKAKSSPFPISPNPNTFTYVTGMADQGTGN